MKASCFSAVEAGEGLEPVGVVRGAVLDGPILHRVGDGLGDRGVERIAETDGAEDAAEDFLGESLAHDALAEDIAPEDGLDGFEFGGFVRDSAVLVPLGDGPEGFNSADGVGHGRSPFGFFTAAGTKGAGAARGAGWGQQIGLNQSGLSWARGTRR